MLVNCLTMGPFFCPFRIDVGKVFTSPLSVSRRFLSLFWGSTITTVAGGSTTTAAMMGFDIGKREKVGGLRRTVGWDNGKVDF